VKHIDPTAARIARDDEKRRREKEKRLESRMGKDVKAIFRDAAGKGEKGDMKTTYAVHKASTKHPRKVL
jgi:hypothetical protein